MRSDFQVFLLGQLTHQQTIKQTELAHPQNTPQIDRTYGYDELGHLSQTRTHCPQQPFEAPHQTQYQYDNLGRIQQEKSGTQRHTFYFDPASNLINDPTEKVINNRLSHYQGVRYTYDSLGNLTECQTANGDYQRYTYDLKHQLIRADIHNRYTTESWVYDYDPLGRRIAKSKLNKQGEKQCHTQFIWAGSHLVQEIRKGKNNEETDCTFIYIYTHPDSYEPLAQCYKERENAQHTVNYFHCDQIGIPREMTDSQGKLLWKGRYDAWGQLIHDSNRHAQRTTHQPFRLQNQYFDQETGLHYNFLRYYEPALGRFITQDPIGLMGGMNLYRFEGTVQNQIDPLGLFPLVLAAPWLLEALAHTTAAMTGILIGVGIMDAKEEYDKAEAQAEADGTAKCNETKCPPCKTVSGRIVPIGTIGYRLDMVPPSKPHYPFEGSHYHIFEAHQSPYPQCRCFWHEIKIIDELIGAPLGAIPVEYFSL